jgi:hypothetical protein
LQHYWLLASEQDKDEEACKASIDYQLLRNVEAVKAYAIKYGTKMVQKELPEGVLAVGRWWGASNGVKNDVLFFGADNDEGYGKLIEFCAGASFPVIGTNVCECDQATKAWKKFLDRVLVGRSKQSVC